MQNTHTENKMNNKINSEKEVWAKFNASFANPKGPLVNRERIEKIVDEKKTPNAYFYQRQIDFSMKDCVFEAGKVYKIPESLFEQLRAKEFKTYNPIFGQFEPEYDDKGKEVIPEKVKQINVPYVLKANEKHQVVDRWEAENLDVHAIKKR